MKISKEARAGLIALLAIVSFFILFQFMKGRSIFSSENYYYVKYNNVDGLSKSSPVSINGLKVGQIIDIVPIKSNNGRIHFVVKISVNDDFSFSKQSIVEIYETGITGDKGARINLAYSDPFAKSGDTLAGNYKGSALSTLFSDIGPIKDKLSSALSNVDSITNNANKVLDKQNREEIKALLQNLNVTIAAFKQTADATNKLIENNHGKVGTLLDNANKTMITANTAVSKYGKMAESINTDELNKAVQDLNKTSQSLNKIITGIDAGDGSMGKLLKNDDLYNNLNNSAKSLNDLMEDIKANPKRYINISVFGK